MAEGIDYRPDGTIQITFDGETWLLARPKLKTYRLFSERLQEMRRAIQQVNTQLTELRERLTEDNADIATIDEEIEVLNGPIWEYSLPIIADLVEQVSDRPLPDPDEWPAWLATSIRLPSDILDHWRTVPLAPGAAGSN